MGEVLKDAEDYLHRVEMSQICLADGIHDCKTKEEANIKKLWKYKYKIMQEVERRLAALVTLIKDFEKRYGEMQEALGIK